MQRLLPLVALLLLATMAVAQVAIGQDASPPSSDTPILQEEYPVEAAPDGITPAPEPSEQPPAPAANAPSRALVRNIAIAMGIGFALVIGGTLFILVKFPNQNEQ